MGALFHQELRFNVSLSVSMSGLGAVGCEGWGRWRELPAGGIRASQGTFSSWKMKIFTSFIWSLDFTLG